MSESPISLDGCTFSSENSNGSKTVECEVLKDQIEEVRFYVGTTCGDNVTFSPRLDWQSVYLFWQGEATLNCAEKEFNLTEITALIPPCGMAWSMWVKNMPVTFLRIEFPIVKKHKKLEHPVAEPFWVPYSQAPTYREPVKSAATVSRTLIPLHRIPNFCMGTVEARGPDAVACHECGRTGW